MAATATNNNVMSVNSQAIGVKSVTSSARTTNMARKQISAKYKSGASSANNFDNVFDRVNNNSTSAANPRDNQNNVSSMDNVNESTPNDPIAAAITASAQGKSKDSQDAPQNDVESVEEISDDELKPSNSKNVTMLNVFTFVSTNVEVISDTDMDVNNGDANLMSILPQETNNNNQSMLDLLSGRNWIQPTETTIDVKVPDTPTNTNLLQTQGNFIEQNMPNNIEISPESLLEQSTNLTEPINTNNSIFDENVIADQIIQNTEEIVVPTALNENLIQQTNLQSEISAQTSAMPNVDLEQQVVNPQAEVSVQTEQQILIQGNQAFINQNQDVENLVESTEIPQVQTAQAENLNENRQTNQQTLADLLGVKVDVDDSQPVTPPQQTMQQDSNPQQNLQSNVQQATHVEVESEETGSSQNSTESFSSQIGIATNNLNHNQPITQVEQPQAAQQAQQEANITSQIVEQARLIRTAENTEMVIHLKPEHLGDLTLKISVTSNGSVNASFHSDNVYVRAMIENSLVQLKQELANQGLKVDNVQVYAGLSEDSLMNSESQQTWQQNQQGKSSRQQNDKINIAALEEDIEAITPINESETTDGVDYRV